MKFKLPLGESYYDYHILREFAFLIYPLSFWRHSLIRNFLQFSESYLHAPRNILEIGCGNGFFSKILSYKFPDSVIISIDTSSESILHAKKRNLKNVVFKNQDFFDVRGEYDLIVSLHVFILLEPKSAFLKVKKLLKRGGIAFITYTKKTFLTELHRRFYRMVVGDDIKFRKENVLVKEAKKIGLLPGIAEINSQEGSFALILKKSEK